MFLENKSDEELMVLYQNGTESAFQELYGRHSAKILGFINSRVRDSQKAHDIFQEVFVKIHKSKHLYNRTLPVLPWIFTITKNTLIDQMRKTKVENDLVELDESSLFTPEVAPALAFSDLAPLTKELTATQRQAIEMRYYEDKTFDEIAKVLNTSSLNVRQLISRGIKRLKEFIQEGERP